MSIQYVLSAEEVDSLEVPELGRVTKGLRVKHPLFGIGTVTAILKAPDGKHSLRVEFAGHGNKALVPEYAKLRLA